MDFSLYCIAWKFRLHIACCFVHHEALFTFVIGPISSDIGVPVNQLINHEQLPRCTCGAEAPYTTKG